MLRDVESVLRAIHQASTSIFGIRSEATHWAGMLSDIDPNLAAPPGRYRVRPPRCAGR